MKITGSSIDYLDTSIDLTLVADKTYIDTVLTGINLKNTNGVITDLLDNPVGYTNTQIDTMVSTETVRATAEETLIKAEVAAERTRVDSILSLSTVDADSFSEIVALINSVDTENDAAFSSYVLANDARSTIIEGNIASNDTAIGSETTRATAAEATLAGDITAAIATAGVYTDAETTRATAAEVALAGDITATQGMIPNDMGSLTLLADYPARKFDGTITLAEPITNFEYILVDGWHHLAPHHATHKMFKTNAMTMGHVFNFWQMNSPDCAYWQYISTSSFIISSEYNSWIRRIYGVGRL